MEELCQKRDALQKELNVERTSVSEGERSLKEIDLEIAATEESSAELRGYLQSMTMQNGEFISNVGPSGLGL